MYNKNRISDIDIEQINKNIKSLNQNHNLVVSEMMPEDTRQVYDFKKEEFNMQ